MTDRRLVLLRHAKAQGEGSTDTVRELAPKGRRDAAAVGRWLAAGAFVPDLAVVSPAVRAAQTWALAAAELPAPPPSTVDDRIYDNSIPALLAVVAETAPEVGTLALVGHNPSMGMLAAALDDRTGADSAELARGFPTAAVAVLELPDWTARTATLFAYAVPRG